MNHRSNQEALNQSLQKVLSDAQLRVQQLPQCPSIKLLLLDPSNMARSFSATEVEQIEQNPAYWSFCWASGQVLAREILKHPEWVKGKTLMDFGTGSGVVAIAAAKAGAQRVIACDLDPVALMAAHKNAQLNNVSIECHEDILNFHEHLDLLIAADVLYDQSNLALRKPCTSL